MCFMKRIKSDLLYIKVHGKILDSYHFSSIMKMRLFSLFTSGLYGTAICFHWFWRPDFGIST